MPKWSDLQGIHVLNNTAAEWLLAALVVLLIYTLLPLARRYLAALRRRHADRDLPAAIGLLSKLAAHTSRLVLWIVALYAAERILDWPPRIDHLFDVAIVIGVWLQVGLWSMAALKYALSRRRGHEDDVRLAGSLNILLFVARLLVWGIVALLALSNLGVNITALVAGLGVGGVAIALAVQTVLGDLFASLSIALDKPFTVGDALRVDDVEGVVEQIGIKSTRLRSVTGEQVIVSNNDLLKSRVRNLGRMPQRRGQYRYALAWGTPRAQVEAFAGLVRGVVEAQPGARFGNCYLKELGEGGIVFEGIFFVEHARVPDIGVALDAINRGVLAACAERNIDFAHPLRTLVVRGAAGADSGYGAAGSASAPVRALTEPRS
ncbi:MAG: mechanosensitive ion channel family protein [Gammaproteobacteria bacterium]|nr:mechanosensitive ion channel family protein [Gammaproteobacteria bacterium]